jgi:tetratricopeptide (TPR) repeat protein
VATGPAPGGPIAPLPIWTVAPAQERRLLVQAVARFLGNVAGPAGTVLVLDDLQWAGPDALAVLTALLGAPGTRPLRVVGAYRDTEVTEADDLAVMLGDLAHANLATHHTVPPLSPEEAEQLLAGLWADASEPGVDARALLVRRAGGLPFFLVSSARTAHERGTTVPLEVPWDVAHSVRQRVGALPEDTQSALQTAAILGRVAPISLLAGTLAYPAERVVDALAAACRAGLLREEGVDTYVFAHDLIREVIEDMAGAPRQALLHQRIAEILEQQPGLLPVALLAYHYARSPRRDRAVVYLERAGDEAHAAGAHAAAEGHYRQLLAEVERAGEAPTRARVREKLGAALTALARYTEALALLDEAVALYEGAQDREAQAFALARIATLLTLTWTPEVGLPRLQALIGVLEAAGPTPGLAVAYNALSKLYFFAARYPEQWAAADSAAALARAVGDERLLADIDLHHGLALHMRGQGGEARTVLDRATVWAERAGSDLLTLGLALCVLGSTYEDEGAFAPAMQYTERAVTVAERQGDVALQAYALTRRGTCALHRGYWDQARRDCARAVDLGRPLETSWLARYPLLDLGRCVCALATGTRRRAIWRSSGRRRSGRGTSKRCGMCRVYWPSWRCSAAGRRALALG